ncbi:MAG: hypothetical protein IPH05_11450 [Flavobacteriales bacterium]|nr:hypothetical protein [Flavobacteriales bacterium]MBK6883540.1 hypothetical protein [Flavobacteriales bacterium]MBK7113027.1 hypothetical protein [Flavobacteriales bacterium]MBK7482976.1 hypothetical protein [Flavobacteriales bacterium]MBK7619261.1 hypothetical protein [Flavobacteriales bacterium]
MVERSGNSSQVNKGMKARTTEWSERRQHKNTMPRKKKQLILTQPVKEGLKAIKVRLDARTVVTLASKKALEFWRQRYPALEVIG